MKKLAILTNSFVPDFERFTRLHDSVLAHTDPAIQHHVIVPTRDLKLFRSISSDRLTVWQESEVLPSHIKPTDHLAAAMRKIPMLPSTFRCSAVNLRRPWPPLRGWVLQQILKFAAVERIEADALLVIDSDVVLVRPVEAEQFFQGNVVRLYDEPGAIDASKERHVQWVHAAHRLLGLAPPEGDAYSDNVAGIVSWDPQIVAACLRRVETVTKKDWATAFGSELHISEFILYGTYVRHFGTSEQRSFMRPTTLCHSRWTPEALQEEELDEFVRGFGSEDIAVHVQSNSSTGIHLVDQLIGALSESEKPEEFSS